MDVRFILLVTFWNLTFCIKEKQKHYLIDTSTALSEKLGTIGDRILGISDIEHVYENSTSVSQIDFDPHASLDEITQVLKNRIDNVFQVLNDNKRHIEESHAKGFPAFSDVDLCCNIDSSVMEFNTKFNENISKTLCFNKAGDTHSSHGNSVDRNHAFFFRENEEKSLFLLSQYFGDSKGNYFRYPAKTLPCDKKQWHDARFQDWYVHTALPKKKNVVIVIDGSGSMSMGINGIHSNLSDPTRSSTAKEAALTVMSTLSITDNVGVVIFNDQVLSSVCSPTSEAEGIHMMVPATDSNKIQLQNLVNSVPPNGSTYYEHAFARAFELLGTSKKISPQQFENSLDLILFLTDGTPDDSPESVILEGIAKGQNVMEHSVHIMVYALGGEIQSVRTPKYFLVQLADQNNLKLNNSFGLQWQLKWPLLRNHFDNAKPVGPPGDIVFIGDSDGEKLTKIMGEFYAHFNLSTHTSPVFSVPHRDTNVGMVLTLSLPTVDQSGNFFGVTAVDILLELTFYEVAHFHLGTDSYAFIVGNEGVVFLHPEMLTEDTHSDSHVFTMEQLEPSLSSEAIYNITNGLEGWESIKKYANHVTKTAVCYYQPLPGFLGNLSVVMVIFDEDLKQKRLQNTNPLGFPDFLYHRQILASNMTSEQEDLCSRNNKVVIPTNSTIKFAPGSFLNLEQSLMYEQNGSFSTLHKVYKNSTGFSRNTGVTELVAEDVELMNEIDKHWKTETDVVWRYLGTENGVFKVFPGTLIPDILYDPREDVWYTTALSQSQNYTFMASPQSSDSMVTIAKAFHQSNKSVHGVIAADISIQHFQTLVYNSFVSVQYPGMNAVVIDHTGHVFFEMKKTKMEKSHGHLTKILPHISSWLLQNGILQMNWCSDIASGESRLTYILDSIGRVVDPGLGDPCMDFLLVPVKGTNLFIIAYTFSPQCQILPSCICMKECKTCDLQQNKVCQCPCKCSNHYVDRCTHQINRTAGYRPCSGPRKHWQKQITKESNTMTTITPCKPVCTVIVNETDCRNTRGCTWCQNGYYQHYPLCVQKCVNDRTKVLLSLACGEQRSWNFSSTERWEIVRNVHNEISLRLLTYKTSRLKQLDTSKMSKMEFSLENTAMEDIPMTWTDTLKEPIKISINNTGVTKTLIYTSKWTEPTDAHIILHISGTNLTVQLQTALTLRKYISKVIHKMVVDSISTDISDSLSGVWPENYTISFWLERPSTMSGTDFTKQVQKLNSFTVTDIDLLGRNATITRVSSTKLFSSLCHSKCQDQISMEDCNKNKGCYWDNMYQDCTKTPTLPERIQAEVYFPCMGMYKALNKTQEAAVLQDFITRIKIPGIPKRSLHSFKLVQDYKLLGHMVRFTIQGVKDNSRVSFIWSDIQKRVDWGQNFIISDGKKTYRSTLSAVSDEEITNMQIVLTFPFLNLEKILQKFPLKSRKVVEKEIVGVVSGILSPHVMKTITNIVIQKDTVKFIISRLPFDSTDLRAEYTQFVQSVKQSKVSISLYGTTYTANDTFFIGSFGKLCPRKCKEGKSETACTNIPNCFWSADHDKCFSDVVLPEQKNLTVIFPCAGFENLNNDEWKKTLKHFASEVTNYVKTLPAGAKVHSFQYGNDFRDSMIFSLQGTAKLALLSMVVQNVSDWIDAGNLKVMANKSITGINSEDFNSLEVALLFPDTNFTSFSLQERKKMKKNFVHQIQNILSGNFNINGSQNIWFDQNFLIFKVERIHPNGTLEKEIERFRRILKLKLLTSDSVCERTQGCFYRGKWHLSYCSNRTLDGYSYTYKMFVPCNLTQTLSNKEKQETEEDLMQKLSAILGPAAEVVQDVTINQDGADIALHATTRHPHLELYVDTLIMVTDYTTGFAFGPKSEKRMLSSRDVEDATNVEIKLKFKSIDLEALQNLNLATADKLSTDIHTQINKVVVGEISMSYRFLWIYKDSLAFELRKSKHSFVNMKNEVNKIIDSVHRGEIILHVSYIRPIVATDVTTRRNFKQLCPDKYPEFTTATPSTMMMTTTTDFNLTIISTKLPMYKPPVILLYNSSEVSRSEADVAVDDTLDVCFVDVRSCEYCITHFSRKTCSYSTGYTTMPTSTPPQVTTTESVTETRYYFGAVQITIMTVSSFFLLALALWAADYVRKAATKKSKFQRKAKPSTGIEVTEGL